MLISRCTASGTMLAMATALALLRAAAAQAPVDNRPQVHSVSPAKAAPGLPIVIRGTGFGGEQGIVWIGTVPAGVTNWSDTEISAVVPPDAAGGPLSVLRTGGGGGRTLIAPARERGVWSAPAAFEISTPEVPDNGIVVSDVKVYDDATLQQMLNTARSQLASMQFLDASGIAARIGSIQGANLQQSAFGLNVGGPALPGVQTTANTGNAVTTAGSGTGTQQGSGSTTTTTGATNELQVTGPSTTTNSSSSNQTVTTGPGTQTVTTLAQQNLPAVNIPSSAAFTPPSSFSPASSNILNQQLELTYEITGYAMLLEGSLSDRFFMATAPGGIEQMQVKRRRATIGVPLTINPPAGVDNCVAEVILEVTPSDEAIVKEPPSLIAVLPRDKTYNVASITDKSVSLGGGVATQLLSAGVSALWGHKTYYVVQDQDTVAIQLPADPSRPQAVRFGWQIRPVLGRKTVQGGMRTLFAQLAFPVLPNVRNFGYARVITRWKKLDRKHNTVDKREIQPMQLPAILPIRNYDLRPQFNNVGLEDNGDGTVTVRIAGQDFMPGTFVRVGAAAIQVGAANALFDLTSIRFTVPAALLATHSAYVVDRSGADDEIVNMLARGSTPKCIAIGPGAVTARAVNGVSALVTVPILLNADTLCLPNAATDLVVLLGNRVYGLRDNPMQAISATSLSFYAPLDAVRGVPRVSVKRLLHGARFSADAPVSMAAATSVDKAIITAQSDKALQIALIGSGLNGLTGHSPAGLSISAVSDTGAIVTIPRDQIRGVKQMVFKGPAGELLLVAAPDPAGGPSLQGHSAIKAGPARQFTVEGSGFDDLDHVEYRTQRLKAVVAPDAKSITIDLPLALTIHAGTPQLDFYFKKAGTIAYSVSVFDTKLDLPSPAPGPK